MLLMCFEGSVGWAQGPLTPPGGPGPTMKTLDQIEPRKPISALDIPLTITAPGSYFLTEDIAHPVSDAITISSNDVSIDLNGFTIGKNREVGAGIISSGSFSGIAISNGSLRNCGAQGCSLPLCNNVHLTNVTASYSGLRNFELGNDCYVSGCVAIGYSDIGDDGFLAGSNCIFSNCIADSNSGYGFAAYSNCSFHGCIASKNRRSGISGGTNILVEGCIADQNHLEGINVDAESIIMNCTSTYNLGGGFSLPSDGILVFGCRAYRNGQHGFDAGWAASGDGTRITNCVARENGDDGIRLYHSGSAEDNTCIGNTGFGIAASGGSSIIERNHLISNAAGGISASGGNHAIFGNRATPKANAFVTSDSITIGQIIDGPGTIAGDPYSNVRF